MPRIKAYKGAGKIIPLDEGKMLELFQELVDTGLAWKLQGHYGRTAKLLIENGYVTA